MASPEAIKKMQGDDETGLKGNRQPPLPLVQNGKVIERVGPEEQQTITQRYTEEAVKFIRRSQDKLRSVMPGGGNLGGRGIAIIGLAAIALWGFSGFFRVQPDELGVVLRYPTVYEGVPLMVKGEG
jgi:hypothetical protein